jgi:hypothetical protein
VDWQAVTAGLIVLAAAGYLARSAWAAWLGRKAGCGSGCGKCKVSAGGEAEPTNRIPLL